jgi:hypothetical protein
LALYIVRITNKIKDIMERYVIIENRIRKIRKSEEKRLYLRLKYSSETFFISLEEAEVYFDERGFTVVKENRIENFQYEDILEIF